MSSGRRGAARVCRDRCEVCDAVIEHRPDPKRRRCADHLDQLDLIPLSRVRAAGPNGRSGRAGGA